jgi:hypothetical protein
MIPKHSKPILYLSIQPLKAQSLPNNIPWLRNPNTLWFNSLHKPIHSDNLIKLLDIITHIRPGMLKLLIWDAVQASIFLIIKGLYRFKTKTIRQ